MLFHFVKNLRVYLRALRQNPLQRLQDTTVLPQRVRWTDLDYNGHMNNARYLDVFELGRVDAMVRSGLAAVVMRHRYAPIVGSLQVRYLHELRYGDRFLVHTNIGGWDQRWLWIEQRLTRARDDKVCARAVIRAQVRSRQGPVAPADLFRLVGLGEHPDHHMPPHMANYGHAENELHRALAPEDPSPPATPRLDHHQPHRPHAPAGHGRA